MLRVVDGDMVPSALTRTFCLVHEAKVATK
jgi:hypothetical protein